MEAAQYELVAAVDQEHWWFAGRRAIVGALLEHLLPAGSTVVDVGCGPGGTVASLAGRFDAVGIDNAPEAIDLARSRFPHLPFVLGDAPDDLRGVRDEVAAFLLMDVLEHVEDDHGLLASLVGALAPGGLVLVTVPADMALWSEQDERLGHHRRYDAGGLAALWADLPVEQLLLSHFNSRLYPPIRAIRTGSRLVGRAWGDEGSDMRRSDGPVNAALRWAFVGEQRRLLGVLDGRSRPYRHGVSLVAVLRRAGDPAPAT